MEIGNDTFLGHELLISGGRSKVTIANFVDIGPRVTLVTGTHKIDLLGDHSAGEGLSLDICIEDGVWIGAGTTIIGGVTIGKKAVIAAGRIVTKDIPPCCIAAGVPCCPKKTWDLPDLTRAA